MRRKRVKIGDILQIPLSNGKNAYGQYVLQNDEMGPLVQIFELITDQEIDISTLVGDKLRFPPVHVGLFAAIRLGLWKMIGHLPVTSFEYPNFVSSHYDEKTFIPYNWFLWDGKKYIPLGSKLPQEYRHLEYLIGWSPETLTERIETGENFYDRLIRTG